MRKPGFFVSVLLATALVLPQVADARGGFRGRAPRMNFGGGGMHGGGFHHFNAPSHMEPRFHPAQHQPHPVHPGPRPGPHPGPHPGPGPHPHPPVPPHPPGPGPHPPGPGPHPPGPPLPPPPPPPPPGPYWPGYWGPSAAWGAAAWGTATAIAVGTVIATLPPECTTFVVRGVSYKDCGGRWFETRYDGHTVVYVAVADPR